MVFLSLRTPIVDIESDPEGLTTAIQSDDLSLTLVQRVKIKFVYLDHFSLFVCGGESRSFDEVITFLTDYRFRFFKETLRCKFLDQRFKCLESFSFIQIDVERLIYIQYRKIKTRRRSNKNN